MKRGVKQEDPISPNLFTCLLEDISFKSLEWDYGISINGLRLNNLRFADDIILIGKRKEEFARMGIELFKECEKRGRYRTK